MEIAKLIVNSNNQHGEGVFWDSATQKVWWTDIFAKRIWSYNPITKESESIEMPSPVCCFAPRKHGGFIMAFDDRVSFFDLERGELECIHRFESTNKNTRLNDGRTDRDGNFIVGGMNDGTFESDSSVIHISQHLKVTTLLTNIACANSTCFSPDGKIMYFADTPKGEIVAYPYEASTATLKQPLRLMSFSNEPGVPDGSCVDSEGGVWNAEWEGGRVVRINTQGEIDYIVHVPVCKPTCCAFGGANLDTLYITTSQLQSTEEVVRSEPGTGGLFAVKTGHTGLVDTVFGG